MVYYNTFMYTFYIMNMFPQMNVNTDMIIEAVTGLTGHVM